MNPIRIVIGVQIFGLVALIWHVYQYYSPEAAKIVALTAGWGIAIAVLTALDCIYDKPTEKKKPS